MTVRCSDPHASGLDIRASPAKRLHQTAGPDGKWGERRDGFGFLARALKALATSQGGGILRRAVAVCLSDCKAMASLIKPAVVLVLLVQPVGIEASSARGLEQRTITRECSSRGGTSLADVYARVS